MRRLNKRALFARPTDRVHVQLATPTAQDLSPPDDYVSSAAEGVEAPEVAEKVDEDDEDDEEPPQQRTREYIDRFHVVDGFPSSIDMEKACLLKIVLRLVIASLVEFEWDDWGNVRGIPWERKGLSSTEDMLDDFHFNREWWCLRVRLYPPPGEESAANCLSNPPVRERHTHAATNPAKSNRLLENLEAMCREGKATMSAQPQTHKGLDLPSRTFLVRASKKYFGRVSMPTRIPYNAVASIRYSE